MSRAMQGEAETCMRVKADDGAEAKDFARSPQPLLQQHQHSMVQSLCAPSFPFIFHVILHLVLHYWGNISLKGPRASISFSI